MDETRKRRRDKKTRKKEKGVYHEQTSIRFPIHMLPVTTNVDRSEFYSFAAGAVSRIFVKLEGMRRWEEMEGGEEQKKGRKESTRLLVVPAPSLRCWSTHSASSQVPVAMNEEHNSMRRVVVVVGFCGISVESSIDWSGRKGNR